jgi:hypothetical protein
MSQPPISGPNTPGGAAPVDPPRKKRPAWLIPLIAAIAVIALLLLLLSQCAGDDSGTDAGTGTSNGAGADADADAGGATDSPATGTSTTAPTDAPTTTAPEPTTPPTPTSSTGGDTTTSPDGTATDTTLVTTDGTPVLPLAAATAQGAAGTEASGTGLATLEGQSVQATGVTVESVPADEGFWVGTGDQRVWVQLEGSGESAFTVQAGQRLTFTAQVVPHDGGFADTVGVTADEGAGQLDGQGQHLLVDRSTLALTR